MSIPALVENVVDGGLNIISGNAAETLVLFGVCTAATPNTLLQLGDPASIQSALGAGHLAEDAAYHLSVAGGPVNCMPCLASVAGGLSAVTHTGAGAGTVTAAAAPHVAITVVVTTGGALDTAKATYQLGSGPVSAPVVLPAGHTYAVPGTYCTITWPTHTYNALESYVFNVDGTIVYAANSSGGATASPTQASSPVDDYQVVATIATGGANASAAAFATYSLDGGNNVSAPFVVPASTSAYAIPGSGVVLTFSAATYALGDAFSLSTCGPTFASGDESTAMTALQATNLAYSMVAIRGKYTTAAAAETAAAAIQLQMESDFNAGRPCRAFINCPTPGSLTASGGAVVVNTESTDAAIASAFQSLAAPRVAVAAGDVLISSPLTGLALRRNCSWAASARAMRNNPARSIGAFADGGLSGVSKIFRNEAATPGLNALRFITTRSWMGQPGIYITNAFTMSTLTSSYSKLTNARVIDEACALARQAGMPLMLSNVATSRNPKTPGVISEKAAQAIEGRINGILNTAMVDNDPADAVAASVAVNRTHNILSDSQVILSVSVQPFAEVDTLTMNIGLSTVA